MARVRVYLWRLTYDTARDDYKFQLTSVENNRFEFSDDVATVVMGYYPEMRLYVAADAEKRHDQFGSSPAIQARRDHLDLANRDGFSAYEKVGTEETAVAVRYDFLTTYLINVRRIHELGEMPGGVTALDRIAETRGEDEAVPAALAPRGRDLVTVSRSIRASDFRKRVMIAYENQCSACTVQLRLVEAAHIIPAGAAQSSDETCNGIALCAIHHLAYDNGLLGIYPDFTIGLNESALATLAAQSLAGGLDAFRKQLRPSIVIPHNAADRPRNEYLEAGLRQRGWKL